MKQDCFLSEMFVFFFSLYANQLFIKQNPSATKE